MTNIALTRIIRKEGSVYSALCPELDVASQGITPGDARANLKEAIAGHLLVARREGLLDDILKNKSKIVKLSVLLHSV